MIISLSDYARSDDYAVRIVYDESGVATRRLYRQQLADAFADELARLQARYDAWLRGRT